MPLSDAHIHLKDLLGRDPGFPERLAPLQWRGCAASHDEPEWYETELIRARIAAAPGARASFVSSFGIHPQWAVWKNADFLASLAAEGKLAAIGEAGFDFFGDRPERVRNAENESAQRAIFEYQLGLAERHGLPLLIHVRKATDLMFAYSVRLARLPGVIFHSCPLTLKDCHDLLARRVPAWFSFGAPLINGRKASAEACAGLPLDRLLSETDAPWQPPKGSDICRFEHVADVAAGMAALRGMGGDEMEELLDGNFGSAYGL